MKYIVSHNWVIHKAYIKHIDASGYNWFVDFNQKHALQMRLQEIRSLLMKHKYYEPNNVIHVKIEPVI